MTMDVDFRAPGMRDIVDHDPQLTQVAGGIQFGEGPVWDKRSRSLYFVDIVGDAIWRWTPGVGAAIVIRPSGHANGMTFDREGRLLVAGWSARRVWRRESDGSLVTIASHYQGKKLNTPNDLVVRSDGSIFFTDTAGGMFIPGMEGEDTQRYLDFQGVYRIPPDGGALQLAIADCVYPNGIVFSPDERLLYVNDTRMSYVRVFDVHGDGGIGPGRIFYELQGDEAGHADGMKIDQAGNLYCTGPAGVHVIAPDGVLLGRLRIPGICTNMAWGDDDWRSLYITSLNAVYRTRVKIPGIPVW
jgi:gluconolactonase